MITVMIEQQHSPSIGSSNNNDHRITLLPANTNRQQRKQRREQFKTRQVKKSNISCSHTQQTRQREKREKRESCYSASLCKEEKKSAKMAFTALQTSKENTFCFYGGPYS